MNYAKSLRFEQEPSYKYLKNLFNTILKKNNFNFERNIFSWIKTEDNLMPRFNSVGKNINEQNKKSSPQNRLYNKIKESIENKKNIIIINKKQNRKSAEHNNIKKLNGEKIDTNPKLNNKEEPPNSELSNTMKVMINKNINSGYNENINNFQGVSSENNKYHENYFSHKINSL